MENKVINVQMDEETFKKFQSGITSSVGDPKIAIWEPQENIKADLTSLGLNVGQKYQGDGLYGDENDINLYQKLYQLISELNNLAESGTLIKEVSGSQYIIFPLYIAYGFSSIRCSFWIHTTVIGPRQYDVYLRTEDYSKAFTITCIGGESQSNTNEVKIIPFYPSNELSTYIGSLDLEIGASKSLNATEDDMSEKPNIDLIISAIFELTTLTEYSPMNGVNQNILVATGPFVYSTRASNFANQYFSYIYVNNKLYEFLVEYVSGMGHYGTITRIS